MINNKQIGVLTLAWLLVCSSILIAISLYTNDLTFIILAIFSCLLSTLSLIETIQIFAIYRKRPTPKANKEKMENLREQNTKPKRNMEI